VPGSWIWLRLSLSCQLQRSPRPPRIAQALYDHSLSKYSADEYGLAGCVEQGSPVTEPTAPNGGNGSGNQGDPEPLDGVPPDVGESSVVVSTGALGNGQTFEARLTARFAALEAQFAAFKARAANGFGRFPDSGDDTASAGQAASARVSIAQEPVVMAQSVNEKSDSPVVHLQKAKDGKRDRAKERRGKRDRDRGKRHNRR
jgi:hypothetical protein